MEVAARELDSRAARRRDDLRLTLFVNREAAPGLRRDRGGGRRARRRRQPHPVGARGAAAASRGSRPRAGMRARALARLDRAAQRCASRGSTTIHDLNYLRRPGRALRACAALGMRVLVPAAARRSHRVIVDAASRRATTSSSCCGCRRRRSTSCRSASAPPAAPRRRRRPSCARALELGDRAGRALRRRAKRPHKNLHGAARGARRSSRRAPADARAARLPHPVRGSELREHAARLGVARRRALPRLDLDTADLEGLYALAALRRVPVALRGLRAAGARGDGARGAGGLLGPRLAARGGGRRRAARSTPRTRRTIAAAIERLLGDPALPSGCARPGRARAARFTWERTAELTRGELPARARRAR